LKQTINMKKILVVDYVSVYHSVISGIDPSPVSAIDFIKERLSKD